MRMCRFVALLLSIGIAAGPGLLDRCLISCHDQGTTAADEPSCHEHAVSGQDTSWHGLTACDHGHDPQPVDAVGDGGAAGATRHILAVALAHAAFVFEPPAALSLTRPRAAVGLAGLAGPTHAQLRL
ncbi:MAG TPA: hypothetical protein VM032_17550 [Vicinamibacterales bacterium]|nr:hypothetical protein [Vicinamibacterales bacterium]